MGDALGAAFGSGQAGTQGTSQDYITQGLSKLKLDALSGLLGYPGSSGVVDNSLLSPSSAYAPSPGVDNVLGYGYNTAPYTPTDANYNISQVPQQSPLLSFTDYAAGQGGQGQLLQNNLATVQGNTGEALAESNARYGSEYNKAYQAGLGGVGNFISQIATPQIKQSLALQGLEGGGALPEAIGKATSEASLPILQQLAALQQQYMAEQAGITNTGLQGQNTLLQGQAPLLNSFLQSLPGAAATLGTYPIQNQATLQGVANQGTQITGGLNISQQQADIARQQAANAGKLTSAQAASTLFPIADYPRQLSENDLLRRQGLLTTGITGIPTTPANTVTQSTSSKPLFNFFGFGS